MLRNIETAIERTVVSDGSGHYLFTFVAPGSYSVTVKAAGFKTIPSMMVPGPGRNGVEMRPAQKTILADDSMRT